MRICLLFVRAAEADEHVHGSHRQKRQNGIADRLLVAAVTRRRGHSRATTASAIAQTYAAQRRGERTAFALTVSIDGGR